MVDSPQFDTEKADKKLLEYLKKLLEAAKKSQPTARLKKLQSYYLGEVGDKNDSKRNTLNICQPIVETKTALILDMDMTMVARPSDMNLLTDENTFEVFNTMGEIVTGCIWNVFKVNNFDDMKPDTVRMAQITGLCPLHVTWNKSLSNGIGDAELKIIDPLNFFPDPTAQRINQAGFAFVRSVESKFELKKRYPDLWEKIDKLKGIDDTSNSKESNKFLGIPLTFIGAGGKAQSGFSGVGNSDVSGLQAIKNYEIYTCYIKDDSIFYPDKEDNENENEMKELQLQYPYGRYITFCEDVILEDSPIPYPYGIPIDIVYDVPTKDIWGQGQIDQIIYQQDQINETNEQIRRLKKSHVSSIMYENYDGSFDGVDFPQSDAIELQVGTMAANSTPRHLTNSHIEQIQYLREHVQFLVNEALQIVRLNPSLLTGQKAPGITSGEMVQDLNESPLASIRTSQRALMSFMGRVSEKIIKIVQLYYTAPRIIRISEGKKVAKISPSEGNISIYDAQDTQNNLVNQTAIMEIKGDLSIGDYELEPVPESMQYQSQAEIASQTLQFAAQGLLGDTADLFIKEQILRRSGFRNYQIFISRMKQMQQEAKDSPPNVASLLEKLTGSIKDLPGWAQLQILKQEGFSPPPGLYPPEITDIPSPNSSNQPMPQ